MAKVSIKDELPQIGLPVGSKEELAALGITGKNLRNISTCSAHEEFNMGCPLYENCDRAWRDARPQNQVAEEVKPDGNMRRYHAPCFYVVGRELVAEKNGGYVEVIGGEGMTYKGRGSERRHPDPVKGAAAGCIACAERKCIVYDDKDDIPVTCPPYPLAEEHVDLRRFARIVKANVDRRERSKVTRRRTLLKDDDGKAAS